MRNRQFLKEITEQLVASLPEQAKALKKDFEKSCDRILQQMFAKFELVTREEFDTQTKVLLRTRQKLEALEAEVKQLETKREDDLKGRS